MFMLIELRTSGTLVMVTMTDTTMRILDILRTNPFRLLYCLASCFSPRNVGYSCSSGIDRRTALYLREVVCSSKVGLASLDWLTSFI